MTLPTSRLARQALRRYPFRFGIVWSGVRARTLFGLPPDGEWVTSRPGLEVMVRADEMYSLLYYTGHYEPDETRLVARTLEPGQCAVDIGANFGWYTALFAKLVGRAGRVIAFEPIEQFYRDACAIVQKNDLQLGVELLNAGVGDRSGSFTVYTYDDLPRGHASSSTLGRRDCHPHDCRLVVLDEALAERGVTCVDFLKCDVEGFEPFVFRGARRTLGGSAAPIVLFEGNPETLAPHRHEPADLFEALRSHGFQHFFTVARGGRLRPVAERDILPGSHNYVAVKSSRLASLSRSLETR